MTKLHLTTIFAMTLACCNIQASASEVSDRVGYSLELYGVSFHTNNEVDYNESNLGFGVVKYLKGRYYLGGGTYRNSYNDRSFYIAHGQTWNLLAFKSVEVDVGIEMGAISGYNYGPKILPMIVSLAEITYDNKMSLVIRTIPTVVTSVSVRIHF